MSTRTPRVGIVGGFGPDTSAAFCARLVEHAHAIRPSHPPAFAVDFVSVPPALACKAMSGCRESASVLLQSVNGSIGRLQGMGAEFIAFPCNTLHSLSDAFAVSPGRFLHIVDAVVHRLKDAAITRVGLLATQLTVSSRLYTDRLSAANIGCIVPSAPVQRALTDAIATFVETGSVSVSTRATFERAFDEFGRQNLPAAILGCTDLSGMLERCALPPPIPCIDSMDVLAKTCAKLCV